MTEEQKHEIQEGIVFEERFIKMIALEFEMTERFQRLPEEKREKIFGYLNVLMEDSKRHLGILKRLVEKY